MYFKRPWASEGCLEIKILANVKKAFVQVSMFNYFFNHFLWAWMLFVHQWWPVCVKFSGCVLSLSSIFSSWTYSQFHILRLMLWGIWIRSVSVTLTREFTMGKSILGISGMIIPGIGCLTTSGYSEVDKLVPDGIVVSGCTTGTASRGFSSWWVALFLPVLLGLALAYGEEVFLFDLLIFCSGIKTIIYKTIFNIKWNYLTRIICVY